MLFVQYGYIFLVMIFLLLFFSPEGSGNKETKISELGKYISYCTLSRAITITYNEVLYIRMYTLFKNRMPAIMLFFAFNWKTNKNQNQYRIL